MSSAPLLQFKFKVPPPTSPPLLPPLKSYLLTLSHSTTDSSLEALDADLKTLERQRNKCLRSCSNGDVGAIVTAESLSDLVEYHGMLLTLESKGMPVTDSSLSSNSSSTHASNSHTQDSPLAITWSDGLVEDEEGTGENIRFERLSVMFNIAIAYMNLQSLDAPTSSSSSEPTEQSLKIKNANFLQSASILTEIMLLISSDSNINSLNIPSLKVNTLNFVLYYALAEAQSAVYHKAIITLSSQPGGVEGKVKPGVVAKLAKGTSDFYSKALEYLTSETALSLKGIAASYGETLGFLKGAYLAFASSYLKIDAKLSCKSKSEGYGLEIARAELTLDYISQALVYAEKISKASTPSSVGKSTSLASVGVSTLKTKLNEIKLNFTDELVQLEEDNKMIYMESVPSIKSLPVIVGVSLVKVPPLSDDLNVKCLNMTVTGLFRGCSDISVRKGRVLFEGEVDKLLNATRSSCTNSSKLLTATLTKLNLPTSLETYLNNNGGSITSTSQIWSNISDIKNEGGWQSLLDTQDNLQKCKSNCQALISDSRIILKDIKYRDEDFQIRNRTYTVNESTSQFESDLSHYDKLVNGAGDSDNIVSANIRNAEYSVNSILAKSLEEINRELSQSQGGNLDRNLDLDLMSGGNMSGGNIDTSELYNAIENVKRLQDERGDVLMRFESDVEGFDFELKVNEFRNSSSSSGSSSNQAAAVNVNSAGVTDVSNVDFNDVVNKCLESFDGFQIGIDDINSKQASSLEHIAVLSNSFTNACNNDPLTQSRNNYLQTFTETVQTFTSLKTQVVEGLNFYTSLLPRLLNIKASSSDNSLMVTIWHTDHLALQEERVKNVAREKDDAALARSMAEEGDSKERWQREDLQSATRGDEEYAKRLAEQMQVEDAMEMSEGAGRTSEKEKSKGEKEKEKESGVGGFLNGFQSWFGAPKENPKDDKTKSLLGGKESSSSSSSSGPPPPPPPFPGTFPGTTAASSSSSSLSGFPGNRSVSWDSPPIPTSSFSGGGGGGDGGYRPPSFDNNKNISNVSKNSSGSNSGSNSFNSPPPPFPGPPPPFPGGSSGGSSGGSGGGGGSIVAAEEDKVRSLCDMGFERAKVVSALVDQRNNVELAMNQLLAG